MRKLPSFLVDNLPSTGQRHVEALVYLDDPCILHLRQDDSGLHILARLDLCLLKVVGQLLDLANLVLDILLLQGLGKIVSLLLHLRSAPASATSEKIERLR